MAAAAEHRASRYFGPKEDTLEFLRLSGQEWLGRPYELNVELISRRGSVQPPDLLGETAAVQYTDRDGYERYFHGYVTAMEARGVEGRSYRYAITLRPWLALLDHTADCRIFQELSAVQIIETVFQAQGYSDYELALSHSPALRSYCVQYQETSFEFVSRLMEEEGIYYYFRHEKSKHVMVLADDPSSHSPDGRFPALPFYDEARSDKVHEAHVTRLTATGQITSGPIEIASYDFAAPRKDLAATADVAFTPSLAEYKVFSYSGRYTESRDGDRLALVRAQVEHARREVYHGASDAPAIAVGNLLSIERHPQRALNREYLITSTAVQLESDDRQGGAPQVEYRSVFTLVPSNVVYRSPQITRKPLARGLQTALVVGKSGEEIWTDEHGRVKVQFHWDRYGHKDENSSCWVRVSQLHAGAGWGGIDLPRIGEEVVVAFEHGDPDHPVVIGRLYNGQAKPPYALPDMRTRSGIKTNSSKGGGGFNELRFEDKQGEEEVYFRAEKDLSALIRNDHSVEIGNDQQLEVGNNRTITVGKKLAVDAGEEITLVTGQSKLVMKKNGDIEISGMNITLSGTKIELKGKQEIKLKSGLSLKAEGTMVEVKGSAKVSLKAAMLELGADAMAKLKGALTMIG